jgi:acyl-CoA synthetase (AMP-forming)/AMP-acid ligase II
MSASTAAVSFADHIFHHALSRPQKPAIILPDRVVTYAMMAQGIASVEERLRALALPAGALVCLCLASPIRTMIVGAALFRLGHPLTTAARPDDVMALRLPVGAYLQDAGFSLFPGQRQVVIDDGWFAGEPRQQRASPPQGFADDRQIALIALSSGTTGRPKAVSLTLDAFQAYLLNYYSTLGLGTWDRLLLLIGLTSSWGYTIAAHALQAGRTLIFPANPREALHLIAVYGADAMAATSLQLREVLREQMRMPLPTSSLRTILTGGGLLSREMTAEARAHLCGTITILYGSSEAGGTAFALADQLTGAEGATGFVAPWAELEIVDAGGNVLPAGEQGIVRIRSTCQSEPYPPGAANDSFRDGWFYPGDLARVTADGLLVLSGRTSEVINVGGLKLAPELIEDTLRKHPSVTDVAAFGGMAGGGIEEITVAVVAARPLDDKQLIAWGAERGIPIARVCFVDSLPKTPSGKVHRDLIKRQLGDGA